MDLGLGMDVVLAVGGEGGVSSARVDLGPTSSDTRGQRAEPRGRTGAKPVCRSPRFGGLGSE